MGRQVATHDPLLSFQLRRVQVDPACNCCCRSLVCALLNGHAPINTLPCLCHAVRRRSVWGTAVMADIPHAEDRNMHHHD
eukprot:1029754-Pelagomonas_calceolata.AAC.1